MKFWFIKTWILNLRKISKNSSPFFQRCFFSFQMKTMGGSQVIFHLSIQRVQLQAHLCSLYICKYLNAF